MSRIQIKNQTAIRIFEQASESRTFFCSLLCLQETAFVLSKLNVPSNEIEEMIAGLLTDDTANYSVAQYKRAIQLAKKVGFQNINDCLHTEIAKDYCTELYTFNQSDFKLIQKYTKLKINIL